MRADGCHDVGPVGIAGCTRAEDDGNLDMVPCHHGTDRNNAGLHGAERRDAAFMVARGYTTNDNNVHLQDQGASSYQDAVLYTEADPSGLARTSHDADLDHAGDENYVKLLDHSPRFGAEYYLPG